MIDSHIHLPHRLFDKTFSYIDFDGKEFSEEFYAALAQLDVLKDLVFAEYSPV